MGRGMPALRCRHYAWIFLWASSFASAQVRSLPSPAEQRPPPEEVRPASAFDRVAAEAALAKGRAVIEGVACAYHKTDNPLAAPRMFVAAGQKVMLFPATPYFDEVFALVRKPERRSPVKMSDEALNTRIDAQTDDAGAFRFTEMRPGSYYLYLMMKFNQALSRNVYAGTSVTDYGDVDHYGKENYSVPRADLLLVRVEIKGDGVTVKTVLLGGEKPGLIDRMHPCR